MDKYGSYEKQDFKSAKDWHIYHVYSDPEFIVDFNKLDVFTDDTSAIKKKYAISGHDLLFFEMRKHLYARENIERKGALLFDPRTHKQTLEFDYDISKAEFMEFWDEFVMVRDKLVGKLKTKRKSPENHELIYAIFKARTTGLTFAKIFELYSDGKLPLYNGATPEYIDEDKLQAYYDKFKPKNT